MSHAYTLPACSRDSSFLPLSFTIPVTQFSVVRENTSLFGGSTAHLPLALSARDGPAIYMNTKSGKCSGCDRQWREQRKLYPAAATAARPFFLLFVFSPGPGLNCLRISGPVAFASLLLR